MARSARPWRPVPHLRNNPSHRLRPQCLRFRPCPPFECNGCRCRTHKDYRPVRQSLEGPRIRASLAAPPSPEKPATPVPSTVEMELPQSCPARIAPRPGLSVLSDGPIHRNGKNRFTQNRCFRPVVRLPARHSHLSREPILRRSYFLPLQE